MRLIVSYVSQNSQDHICPLYLTANSTIAQLPALVGLLKRQQIDKEFMQCPDILATYLEVVNNISAFSIRHSISVEPIQVDITASYGSALLRIHLARHEIYSAFMSNDSVQQLRDLFLSGKIGADTMTSALALLPDLWGISSTPYNFLAQLCQLYVDICLKTRVNEPQAVALLNLADIMDELLGKGQYALLESLPLTQLWASMPSQSMNPALSNALVRASGCFMAIFLHFQQTSPSGLRSWGAIVANAGSEDEVSPLESIKATLDYFFLTDHLLGVRHAFLCS